MKSGIRSVSICLAGSWACLGLALPVRGASMHEVAEKAVRPAGAPGYADVCFRYGWIRESARQGVDYGTALSEFPTIEDAKQAIRAFHATRIDWFYPGSHTADPDAEYVTDMSRDFIDWCHARKMKVVGAINSNTTTPDWEYRKHHLDRYVGDPEIPAFVEAVVAWGKAQIDAGVDTMVCDDIFKFDAQRQQLWSDSVLAVIRAYKPGFTIAGNNGGTIGADYVKRFAVDYHYSDNNFVPDPSDWWSASKAHRKEQSAFLIHPNRHISKDTRRKLIGLGYAAGAHVIAPWDEYIHGKERLFADPADFADLYGFARALGQAGCLNDYEDAAVGGYDLKETRYGDTPPIAVNGGTLSAFARAKPGQTGSPIVIHLVEWSDPEAAVLRLHRPALFGGGDVSCTLLTPIPYTKKVHEAAAASGNYESLLTSSPIKAGVEGDSLVVDVPPLSPWGVLLIKPSED